MKPIDKFVNAVELMERIKSVISPYLGNKKVSDGDIALLLRVSQSSISTLRKRNSDVLRCLVMKMCARTGLDPMKLLF